MVTAGNGVPDGFTTPHKGLFAPRLGFAYRLTNDGKTSHPRRRGLRLHTGGPAADFKSAQQHPLRADPGLLQHRVHQPRGCIRQRVGAQSPRAFSGQLDLKQLSSGNHPRLQLDDRKRSGSRRRRRHRICRHDHAAYLHHRLGLELPIECKSGDRNLRQPVRNRGLRRSVYGSEPASVGLRLRSLPQPGQGE